MSIVQQSCECRVCEGLGPPDETQLPEECLVMLRAQLAEARNALNAWLVLTEIDRLYTPTEIAARPEKDPVRLYAEAVYKGRAALEKAT